MSNRQRAASGCPRGQKKSDNINYVNDLGWADRVVEAPGRATASSQEFGSGRKRKPVHGSYPLQTFSNNLTDALTAAGNIGADDMAILIADTRDNVGPIPNAVDKGPEDIILKMGGHLAGPQSLVLLADPTVTMTGTGPLDGTATLTYYSNGARHTDSGVKLADLAKVFNCVVTVPMS